MAGSLRPSDAATGGLLDDAEVVLKSARFVKYDFAGKSPLRLTLAVTMVDSENKEHIEYYSAGDLKFFVPTADGKGYDKVGEKTALYRDSNAVLFIASAVKAGFPESRLGEDISVFDGLRVHVKREAQKARNFRDGRKQKEDATILLVDKILGAPGGATVGSGAAPGSPAADASVKAIEAVQKALAANGGTLPLARVPVEVFKNIMTDPQRNDILKLVTPDFLTAAGRPWAVAGDTVVG